MLKGGFDRFGRNLCKVFGWIVEVVVVAVDIPALIVVDTGVAMAVPHTVPVFENTAEIAVVAVATRCTRLEHPVVPVGLIP